MRPEDLSVLLKERPFVPFRVCLTDGKFYDIVHPEAVLVLKTRAIIGTRPDPKNNYYTGTEQFGLLHVVRTSEILAAEVEQTSSPAG